jgi:GAF domain-containing protein
MDLDEVKSTYPELLRKYLFEGKEEEALYGAYMLGKECFEAKIGIEDIMNLHTQCLEEILKSIPPSNIHDIVLKSSNLLIEFSIRFGLVCQDYFKILQQTDEKIRNAFFQAGEALTAGLNLQKMLSVIIDVVRNLIEAAGCAIIVLEDDRVIIKTSEGLNDQNEIFKDFLFEAINEGKIKTVHDLREEKSRILLEDGREIRSILAIPLNLKGKIIGALGICMTVTHHFDEKDISLLTSFSYQAASAINNAFLFTELSHHDSMIKALYDIDRVITGSLELEEILKSALSKALEVTKTSAGGIYLLEKDVDSLILKAHIGISRELSTALFRIKIGQGVSGAAVKSGKPVVLDITEYPSPELLSPLLNDGIVSIAGVPLIAKEKIVGAMTLADRRQRTFSRDDLDLLNSIGSQIGVAIDNATLYNELEKHHKILTTLYTIESVTSKSLNLGEIFNVALSKTLEATDTDAGTLYSLDGGVLHLEAFQGISPEFKEKAAIRKMGEGIPGIAAQSMKPITLSISQFPSPLLLPYVENFASFIGTPLMSKGKVMGALALGTKKKRTFVQDDLDLLFSIGNVIGIAIENAKLYKEVKDKAEHISALYRIAQATKASLNIAELFDTMFVEMRRILTFDRTSINLIKNEMVEVFALAGEIEIPELGKGTRIPLEKSSTMFIIDRRAGLARRIEATPFYEDAILFEKGIRSVIQVPLVSKGERIGVLSLESCTPDIYSRRDLDLAQAIADQISTSLENVRLYEELKQANLELERKLKELEEFYEIAVGRELRMVELKKEIEELRKKIQMLEGNV